MVKQVYLVGFMGSGKSTVGPLLASDLDRPFHDLDTIIEKDQQTTISQIFESQGETYFRELESRLLLETQQLPPCVIALGGGTFFSELNRTFISQRGVSIWLKVSIHLIRKRCEEETHRPLAQDLEQLDSLFQLREECYHLADIHIEAQSKSPEQISKEILDQLDEFL